MARTYIRKDVGCRIYEDGEGHVCGELKDRKGSYRCTTGTYPKDLPYLQKFMDPKCFVDGEEPPKKKAYVEFNAGMPVNVSLDGEPIGLMVSAPFRKEISPGYHRLTVSRGGYKTRTWVHTWKEGESYPAMSFALEKEVVKPPPEEPPPVDEWERKVRALVKPANWPAKHNAVWDNLIDALLRKDKARVQAILRKAITQEASPTPLLVVIFGIAGILTLIVTVVGSYPFAAFLFEEALQTYDMGIYKAMDLKQWDLAEKGLRAKDEFLARDIWDAIWGAIPLINAVHAAREFVDASILKLSIDKELIKRETGSVVVPEPGDVQGAARAIEAGKSFEEYLPTPELPEAVSIRLYGMKGLIDSRYWDVVNALKIPDRDLAAGNLEEYNKAIKDIFDYVEKNRTSFVRSKAYESQQKYIAAKNSTAKTLLAQLEAIKPEEAGSIAVSTDPTGATVWLGTVQQKYPSNTVIENLTPKEYTVRVELKGYIEHEAKVTVVKDEQVPFFHKFVGVPEEPVEGAGRLQFEVKDKTTGADLGAAFFIDGRLEKEYGQALALDLKPDTYELKWTAIGYKEYLDTVIIDEGKTTDLTIKMEKIEIPEDEFPGVTCETLGYITVKPEDGEEYEVVEVRGLKCWALKKPEMGKIELVSDPPAEVMIAGKVVLDKTPGTIDYLPGTYDVTFRLEGYLNETRRVYLQAGEYERVSVVMRETPEVPEERLLARVHVSSDPTGAKILINGVWTKKYTPDTVVLEEGEYEVTLTKSGFEPWTTPLRLVRE